MVRQKRKRNSNENEINRFNKKVLLKNTLKFLIEYFTCYSFVVLEWNEIWIVKFYWVILGERRVLLGYELVAKQRNQQVRWRKVFNPYVTIVKFILVCIKMQHNIDVTYFQNY